MSTLPLRECGSGNRSALSRLTGQSAQEFSREHWGQRPRLTRGDDSFEDLFSANAVDELVADRATRTPFVRMASQGAVLDPSLFTSSGGVGAEVNDQLDSAKVLEQFAAGATLVLQGLHRTWEPISTFTRHLVSDLGHPAQVNAYITPASSRGFDPHYDTHDVFVLQIAGAKRWTIHEPVHPHPLENQPWTDHREAVAAAADHEPVIDEVFEPGDVLYLPRGWLHSAVALGTTSIHLTIGVRATTRHDLLTSLLSRAGDDLELRGSLPLGVDYTETGSLTEDIVRTVRAAHAMLDSPELVDTGVQSLQRRFVEATRPAPVRPLATVELIDDLRPSVHLRWRDALESTVVDDEESVRITMRTKVVSLPAEASRAIHALRDGEQLAGSLPGLDPESSLVVSRRLLREGVAVPR